jgi:ABC-type Fe3+-hydroxamate transport system substrate-binding protein
LLSNPAFAAPPHKETYTMNTESKPTRDKRAKFVELAQKRMGNAIKTIRLVGQLSNRAAYDYADADVKKIVAALQREVDDVEAKMSAPARKKSDDTGFTL